MAPTIAAFPTARIRSKASCSTSPIVRALSRLFRGKFLAYLQEAFEQRKLEFHGNLTRLTDPLAFADFLKGARKTDWVVYSKRPFGGPAQVLEYLGRYTHRVAISNNRLVKLQDGKVTFRWKDYRRKNRIGSMTLDADEFIRRFLIHVLPRGFMRLRHYGLLANRDHARKVAKRPLLLGQSEAADIAAPKRGVWKSRYEALTGISFDICPACRQGRMRCVEALASLAPTPKRC